MQYAQAFAAIANAYRMSTNSHRKYSHPPAKRAAFLERVEYYVSKRPRWTPAEGALLVNGVIPPPKGCKDIPVAGDEFRQLDDPDLPATQSQLGAARYVLEDYLDHVKDGDLPPGDDVLSYDFLKWCHISDQTPWHATKLPEFLRYLYFPGSPEHPFTMSVADELASLRIMAAAADALNDQSVSRAEAPTRAVIRHRTNNPKRVNELDPLIEKAIEAAGTDTTGPVWQELKKMALNEDHPFTGEVRRADGPTDKRDKDALVYARNTERKNGSRTDQLTYGALDGRLRRRSKRPAKTGTS